MLRTACGIMNKGCQPFSGKFIVDFYTKSVCYVFKIMISNQSIEPESFSAIFKKV